MKSKAIIAVLLALLLLAGCASPTNTGTDNQSVEDHIDLDESVSENELSEAGENADTPLNELFEEAVREIINLASEDPTIIVRTVLDDVEIISEETEINGEVYYQTTAAFEELRDYYSDVFTGDALDWVLSTKFAEVDGVLYCSPVGGATGWSIENLEITKKEGDSYIYVAIFDEFEQTTTCHFSINSTDDAGYRISKIDYVPDLLKNSEDAFTDYIISSGTYANGDKPYDDIPFIKYSINVPGDWTAEESGYWDDEAYYTFLKNGATKLYAGESYIMDYTDWELSQWNGDVTTLDFDGYTVKLRVIEYIDEFIYYFYIPVDNSYCLIQGSSLEYSQEQQNEFYDIVKTFELVE